MRLAIFLFACYLHAGTPTFSSLATVSLSQNSASVAVTVTGGTSMQIQASTDTSYGITTPWFPVAASAVIFGQLQPNTLYNVRVVACDAAVTAFASCAGNLGTSTSATVTTKTALISRVLMMTTAGTTFYNTAHYPTRYTDGDVNEHVCLQNGTCMYTSGDTWGPQFSLHDGSVGTGGRNAQLSTVTTDFTTITLLNGFGTGNGSNGVGSEGQANLPGCYSDGASNKASNLYAEGNNLWASWYRVTGSNAITAVWIMKSTDQGATWTDPAGVNTATSVPPCAPMWNGTTGAKSTFLYWLKHGALGGAVTNPIDGSDAYRYIVSRDAPGNNTYLMRIFRQLDQQLAGNFEGFTGGPGADANLQANWTVTLLSMSVQLGPFSDRFGFRAQYLSDMARYEMLASISLAPGDNRITMYDAPHITGPWTQRYTEPTPTPFNSTLNAHADRGNPQSFMPSYSLTMTKPPCATLNVWTNGGFPENQDRSSPANNWYSPSMVAGTICGARSLFPMPGGFLK